MQTNEPRSAPTTSRAVPTAIGIAVVVASAWLSWRSLAAPHGSAHLAATGAPAEDAACAPRSAEKLGIPFVRACEQAVRATARELPAERGGFWIGSYPVGCSAGEHETVECPVVTPLGPRAPGAPPAAPRQAAMASFFVAHRTCTMRFGGRLPTRAERELARGSLGLVTLLIVESSAAVFQTAELPEWVTDEACEDATLPDPRCRPGTFGPTALGAPPAPSTLRACEARASAGAAPADPIGVPCLAPGWSWPTAGAARADLPCGLAPIARTPLLATTLTLACAVPPPQRAVERIDDERTAAFRCVVPAMALASFEDAWPGAPAATPPR